MLGCKMQIYSYHHKHTVYGLEAFLRHTTYSETCILKIYFLRKEITKVDIYTISLQIKLLSIPMCMTNIYVQAYLCVVYWYIRNKCC